MEGRGSDHHRLHLGVRGRPRRAPALSTPRGRSSSGTRPSGIDWSQELDPDNPMEHRRPDRSRSTGRRSVGTASTTKQRVHVRQHLQAHSLSQFMHGEQGALIATAKIVQTVPDVDAKFYAATQVMDEARHVEAYSRLLHEKFEMAYPITARWPNAARGHHHRPALGHDLSRYADPDRGARPGRLPAHPRQLDQQPACRRGQRLRHAGRGAPRGLRPPRAARVLPAAHRRRARRARGVRGRGLLPHARPLQPEGGLGEPGPPGPGVRRGGGPVGHHEAVPHVVCSPGSSPP